MTSGPPPPGSWRRNDDGAIIPNGTTESAAAQIRDSQPLPRYLENIDCCMPRPFAPADESVASNITVLIVTSPAPSHPADWLIANVYESIRCQLPDARIVILADGVESEEPESYVEFKSQIRQRGWELVEFKGKHHSALMFREAILSVVKTPLVMFGEHDWGMRKLYIDWRGIVESLLDPVSKFRLIQIRQAKAAGWELGFFGEQLESFHGINLLPTICFQGPMHVARTDWYRQMVPFLQRPQNLEGDDITLLILKDLGYEGGPILEGLLATRDRTTMACYIPDGPMGRLYHLDGRYVTSPDQLHGIGNL
jgi:hypothetical protein